jgi:hypothetical protein
LIIKIHILTAEGRLIGHDHEIWRGAQEKGTLCISPSPSPVSRHSYTKHFEQNLTLITSQFIEPGYLGPITDKGDTTPVAKPSRPPSPAGFRVPASKSGKVEGNNAVQCAKQPKLRWVEQHAFGHLHSAWYTVHSLQTSHWSALTMCDGLRDPVICRRITMPPSRPSLRCTQRIHTSSGREGEHAAGTPIMLLLIRCLFHICLLHTDDLAGEHTTGLPSSRPASHPTSQQQASSSRLRLIKSQVTLCTRSGASSPTQPKRLGETFLRFAQYLGLHNTPLCSYVTIGAFTRATSSLSEGRLWLSGHYTFGESWRQRCCRRV